MTTHEEYERSRERYRWQLNAKIGVLHSELASLYRTKSMDNRRINLLWSKIEELESEELYLELLAEEGSV